MKILVASFLLLCIMISGCTKEYVEMDIISSLNSTSRNWYELEINVIADEDTVSLQENTEDFSTLSYLALTKKGHKKPPNFKTGLESVC